jgi:GTP pyrophosphokinase
LRDQGGDTVKGIVDEIRKTLSESGIEAEVEGREKSPYSIWDKMQRKNISFEQLSDIIAFRVIVDKIGDCYSALGAMHGKYPVVPGRFKDYISTPRPNGYQSLHTGVIGPLRQRIEVQIRTREMHDIAERGVAAHWQYKQGTDQHEGKQYRWLRELLDILENASGPEEFLEHTKLEMFQDQVFCFTPKGDLISLPRGATPVDFAYAVHSEIGNHCVGAKINGRIVPLKSTLQNGDQVEIVTSRAQTPSPTWEAFVATGKARAAIRRFVRSRQLEQYVQLGRAILEKAFQQEGYEYSDKALKSVLKKFKENDTDELIAKVGEGIVTARAVLTAVFPGTREAPPLGMLAPGGGAEVVPIEQARREKEKKPKKKGYAVPLKGLIPGMALHYANCCHPLPGDRIVGIVTTGKGVTIHTIDCRTLESFADMPERWLDVAWQDDEADSEMEARVGRIKLVLLNEPGALSSLSTVIAKNLGNILNLKITHRSTDFFEMFIDVEVRNVKHLSNIIAALRATPAINSVERARG